MNELRRATDKNSCNKFEMTSKKIIYDGFLLILVIIALFFNNSKGNAQVYGQNGMVVSSNVLASQVGIDILKKGGNAIDASVATAFALAVTHPQAGNIGGGGFLVFMNAAGEATTIDFREKAPIAASASMFLDSTSKLIKGINHNSLKTVGVPGTVAGLYMAHQKYGKLPWKDLVQPSIDLAIKGFVMSWDLYEDALFLNENAEPTDFMYSYFRNGDGEITKPGEVWKQSSLAKSLKLIRNKGHDGFYKGEMALEIENYMKKNGGLITKTDLEKYSAIERKPIKGTYKEYEIYSMPPPSSGGVALVEMMNMLELVDLDSIDFNSTAYVHLIAEVMRRAFADRAEYLGDPDFNPDMPLDKLTSKAYAKKRFENIDMSKASVSDSALYGHPYDGNNTTHFSVVDKEGNAVSLTYTLEDSYGSQLGSNNLGFIFNNEMQDFNPVPGVTTNFGQIGSAPNLIAPEKRMLSSMTPTIITENGQLKMVVGTPGGSTIITSVFQVVLNVLEFGMNMQQAVEYPRFHQQWKPEQTRIEPNRMSTIQMERLKQKGYEFSNSTSIGLVEGILVLPSGKLQGGADSRGDDTALGHD
jgi:gamma-glutamyltranspeptidase/glutathione hydrolase